MRKNKIEFCCPACKDRLHMIDNVNVCSGCSLEWPVSEEIPHFNRHDFYWNQIPKDRMKELLRVAKMSGWAAALTYVFLPLTDRYAFDYAMNEGRADWHFSLPLNENSRVLDIGCGWGGITIPLSRFYDVVGIDSTQETLEFLRIRADQQGLKKLQLAMTDPGYGELPFPDSSFDLVVLNGVLEWIGTSRSDISPDECQRRALKEIRRVLKPGGLIYIGIENRYSYTSFIGAREHHNLPFTDLMPRQLANLVSKIAGKKDGYRTYTYGYSGYKILLKNSGFDCVKIYLPVPSYREPIFIFEDGHRKSMQFFIENKFIRSSTKRAAFSLPFKLHLESRVAYSFGILAKVIK